MSGGGRQDCAPNQSASQMGKGLGFGMSDEALGWRRYNLGLVAYPPTA